MSTPHPNSYRTIAGKAHAEIEIKRSQFICSLAHVETDDEAVEFIEKIRALHRSATHNCYAYRLRENNRARYSDDGEPTHTAGLPMLKVLEGQDIVDICAVVTRYFGGTLLGTGGLVRAYTESVQAGLSAAEITTVDLVTTAMIETDYARYEPLLFSLEQLEVKVRDSQFTDTVLITADMKTGTEEKLAQKLQEMYQGDEQVTFCKPEFKLF